MRRAALLLLAAAAHAQEPAELLQSKEVEKRVQGISAIVEKGSPDGEAMLLKALKDRDWEVVHRAVEALGVRGTKAALDEVLTFAVDGPTRAIRLAAAASAKRLDAAAAGAALAKRLKGNDSVPAAEALAIVADPEAAKELERLAKKKGKDVGRERIAALDALGALGDPARIPFFVEYLKDEDYGVRAAAVRALASTKDAGAIGPLREGLMVADMTAVMERRHIAAIRDLLVAQADAQKRDFAAQMIVGSFSMGGSAGATARMARLLGALGDAAAPVGPVDEYLKILSGAGASHADEGVRSAAVHALGRIRRAESYDKLAAVAAGDASRRVRFHALRAAVAIKGDDAQPLLLDRLAKDADPGMREEAAATLGKRRLAGAVDALVAAAGDKEWAVSVAAAVSLGKIRDPRALGALKELLSDKDWRRRGGGVVGLGHIRQKEAVPLLIDMTRDKEPAVARTAVEFLRHISGEKLDENTKSWREWWGKWEPNFTFRDRDAEARDEKKYGYATQPRKVYEDMDIIVLLTRGGGDNIQDLLTVYGIEHRSVRAAAVQKCGLHPYGLFVANCPGEITDKDVEPIQFYVRAGGYLFASCWALTHTVQRCFPDVVKKLETRAQVVDTVLAEPVPVASPFTEGVFAGSCQPFYELMGSHLIHTIDPERFEILIDSPQTATRWGDGNLAGWFTVGHGLILDSANHFDLQGMSQAKLSDEKERMAFAVDHLGYDYTELRALRDEGVFQKQPLAVKRTRDLTIFRFITTFVRQKRLADEGAEVGFRPAAEPRGE
jgi:HEAT repeat protein